MKPIKEVPFARDRNVAEVIPDVVVDKNTVAYYRPDGSVCSVTAIGPDSLLLLFLLGRPFLFQGFGRFFFGLLLTVLAFTHGAVSCNGWSWDGKVVQSIGHHRQDHKTGTKRD